MKKVFLFISLVVLLTASIHSGIAELKAAPADATGTTPIDPLFPGLGVITSRTMEDGRVATTNLAILGPNSCVHLGDPLSPINSTWKPGPHTYTYRIYIPPTYAHDVVRVELFDPDSINTDVNNQTITRSNTAVNNGLSPLDSKSCGTNGGSASQTEPCLLQTDELTLVTGSPNLDIDLINPQWLVRIDENRIQVNQVQCAAPASYQTAANTETLYSLSYFAQNSDETIVQVPLVDYIGQVGDGVRDNGNHLTDMHWVSPGATQPFSGIDSPGVPVPAIARTIDSFEIDLTTDVPNILVDQATGGRYLYLDVRTLSGSSENGYEIWAGPPDYVNTVPSEVNARNIHILNTPGSHDSQGVEITAVYVLVQNTNFSDPQDIPLAYIGPEAAGLEMHVSMFDSDAGAEPPLVFYFDTIAFTPDDSNPLGYDPTQTDWAMAFSVAGQADPDGVPAGARCAPGNCPTQWVNPAYVITLPGDLSSCDWQNPTAENCTPFYGGRLMARYDGGYADTYTWSLPLVDGQLPDNSTQGCSAFPIGINEAARSVTAPSVGSNPYPNPGDFTYPLNPPTYESFLDHQDDVPLLNATPGDVFRVYSGFGNGNFGWLVWNIGVSASANTLTNSLTWPGNSTDYTPCDGSNCFPGPGVPGSGFSYNVPGYIEPGDPTDQALHIGDWIAASTGSINSSAVQGVINGHIDLGRVLRLPIWDTSNQSGVNGRYQTSQFGLFRLVGYDLDQTGGGSWLLLEFMGHDTSCGQLDTPPTFTTFNPVADASVLSNRPDNNFGSSQLRLDAAPTVNSYLRFDIQGVTGAVNSATLRVYVQSTSADGFTAHEVADNSWAENGITFNNAPAVSTAINSSGSTTAGSYVEVDVTNYITGNGLFSLALTTADTALISAQSREGANPPELIVETVGGPTPTNTPAPPTPTVTASVTSTPPITATYTPTPPTPSSTPIPTNTVTPTNTPVGPTPTPTITNTPGPGGSTFTFATTDDAVVLGNRPTSNYGGATVLGTDDSPDVLSFLKFNVVGLNGSVASATLRIFVETAVSPFNVAQIPDNSWAEGSITYSNAPTLGTVLNNSGAISSGSWVEVDVTSYINSDSTFSLALLADGTGRNLFSSSETGNGPELVVVTVP